MNHNVSIFPCKEVKFLGVTLDDHLTFSSNVVDNIAELGPSHNVFKYSACKSSTCTWFAPHALTQVADLYLTCIEDVT